MRKPSLQTIPVGVRLHIGAGLSRLWRAGGGRAGVEAEEGQWGRTERVRGGVRTGRCSDPSRAVCGC